MPYGRLQLGQAQHMRPIPIVLTDTLPQKASRLPQFIEKVCSDEALFSIFDGLYMKHLFISRIGISQEDCMERRPRSSSPTPPWSQEAHSMASQAKVLSGNKLEQLVVRLQRHTGRSKEACWRFIIQQGLKGRVEHRRWTEEDIDLVREELVKRPVEAIAKKLNRSAKALRSMLERNQLAIREIRCDRFSVESLAKALRVRRSEVIFWIEQKWLDAVVSARGKRRTYIITPEALTLLYKNHLPDLLKRGNPSQTLFEAYLQYCYSPKHTVGEQLLDVRRDKRERAAYDALQGKDEDDDVEEDDDEEQEGNYHLDLGDDGGSADDAED
jgi:hypothetical protein